MNFKKIHTAVREMKNILKIDLQMEQEDCGPRDYILTGSKAQENIEANIYTISRQLGFVFEISINGIVIRLFLFLHRLGQEN